MTNWFLAKKQRIVFAIALLLVSWQGYRFFSLALDIRAVFQAKLPISAGSGTTSSGTRGLSQLQVLLEGLTPPIGSRTYEEISALVGSAPVGSGSFFAPASEIKAYLERVSDFAPMPGHLEARLDQALVSWPAAALEPVGPQYFLGDLEAYPQVRTTGHFWCLIARHLAESGQTRAALLAACGPAILGVNLQLHETRLGALTILGKMVGENLVKLSGQALTAVAPLVQPTREQALLVLQWIVGIERMSLGLDRGLANEMNYWGALREKWKNAIVSGEAQRVCGRDPHALVRLLSDQARIDSYYAPLLKDFRLACAEPYPEAIKRLETMRPNIEALTKRMGDFGLHTFEYILDPERVFLELLLGSTLPSLPRLMSRMTTARAVFRAGALAVVLQAFYRERGAWPATLMEAETWLGSATLPIDPFTAQPWQYSPSPGPNFSSPGPDLAVGTADDLKMAFPTP